MHFIFNKLNSIWTLPRYQKKLISLIFDAIFLFSAFYFSYWVRIGEIKELPGINTNNIVMLTISSTLGVFYILGLYQAVLRYAGLHILFLVTVGTLYSTIFVFIFSNAYEPGIPRSLPFIYGAFVLIGIAGSRLMVRSLVSQYFNGLGERVLVYGAGSAGCELVLALMHNEKYQVMGFIDDDESLMHTSLLGHKVFDLAFAAQIIQKRAIKRVFLAIPRASRKKRKFILNLLADLHVEVQTVPDLKDMMEGRANIDELKDVPISDLLGREPVQPQQHLMDANIKDQVVMVTGAGGSIGSELCRQILNHSPKILILFEVSEYALYQIHKELEQLASTLGSTADIVPLLGSVQRSNGLETVMQSFFVDTVYHAAAYKHVPLVEHNVVEGVRNNIFGTYNTAKAAIKAKVKNFVLISTDKAVRPTNIMGTTKRVAELGLQALAEQQAKLANIGQISTRFCMVRFGNVLGSSGSVIPVFKQQIANREPITVTHQDIMRYFMTIQEAAQLVIQAGSMGKGGDVFVLDMGEPVKILDLACKLVHLSGLEVQNEEYPDGEIPIHITGLRPGEKLYEELLIGDDNIASTGHKRIMTANEHFLPLDEYNKILNKLDVACQHFQHDEIRKILIEAPTGFTPVDEIEDLVWKQNHH